MIRRHRIADPVAIGDALEHAHTIDRPGHRTLNEVVRVTLKLGPAHIGTWPLAPSWRQRWRCSRFVGHCWHMLPDTMIIPEWVCCVCTVDVETPAPAERCKLCHLP